MFTRRLLPQVPIPQQEPYDHRKKKTVETPDKPVENTETTESTEA